MAAPRFLAELGASTPIVQAPMAGAGGVELAIAAIRGGAVGSLPCAMLAPAAIVEQAAAVRAGAAGPLNLNFFCHALPAEPDESAWRALLAPYYAAEDVAPGPPPPLRRPFDADACAAVEQVRPAMVSFHFGLPDPALLARVRATGARILGNATTPEELHWLAAQGVDAAIVQGGEAGGHAGWFLGDAHRPVSLADLLATPVGPPLIAAGGIVDAGDIVAALRLGAAAVQIGTAYLATPESAIAAPYRALLGTPASADAAFTTLFSGRAARGIVNRLMRDLGATRPEVPPFPYASAALAPLRAHAEAQGRTDYSPLWAGSGAPRVRAEAAETLTRRLATELAALLQEPI
ncbi:Nitronate monooxygenase [Sphingomonas sp. S2M10]|uniref:NAD(P)H-dependent flavin oxidoreductase n=1 Tax=Sphingomonas sp. S2M10 TaxID=2705010 RepID=UPI0016B97AFF|nr:nitronate monooxygenase family protein [Sphingomonas sp. S2M10]NLS28842.1 Nitronate monooxygenase [Sphingomonas sp. S2M10]